MKIALICPANLRYMPYVKNYTKLIGNEYDLITWDRLAIDKSNIFTYRDDKIGHQRNIFDYYKYYRFIIEVLNQQNYEKVIVFGLQLTFFLQKFLFENFKDNYIVDIRDYHELIKLIKIDKLLEYGQGIVVSSPGYLEWLPESDKYYINHNTNIESIRELYPVRFERNTEKRISIANIGAFRDFKINKKFIESLKNSDDFLLNYHGKGGNEEELIRLKNKKNINNLYLTGEYTEDEEKQLYFKNDLINVLRFNDGINNYTALPNRLYNALIFGLPLLSYHDTYLSKIIKDYNLGLVVNTFNLLDDQILNYVNDFDRSIYSEGRALFFERVMKDNCIFREMIRGFIKDNNQ